MRNMLRMDWEVELRHGYREANSCADKLAKKRTGLQRMAIIFHAFPAFLSVGFLAFGMGHSNPIIVSM